MTEWKNFMERRELFADSSGGLDCYIAYCEMYEALAAAPSPTEDINLEKIEQALNVAYYSARNKEKVSMYLEAMEDFRKIRAYLQITKGN